jgi:hypothetical protein
VKRSALIALWTVLIAGLAGTALAAFFSHGTVAISASAAVSNTGALTLNVPDGVLPSTVFLGKDVVIPVEVAGVTSAASLKLWMTYQLIGPSCGANPAPVPLPIAFQSETGKPNAVIGTALIPYQSIQCLQPGDSFSYWFQAYQSGRPATLTSARAPTAPSQAVVNVVNTLTEAVSPNTCATVPDTSLPDGKTSVCFPPGSISGPGTLVITQLNPVTLPSGPLGLQPLVAYSFDLQGANFLTQVQVTLSYPSTPSGTVIGLTNGNPNELDPFYLVPNTGNWLAIGPVNLDTTLHTVQFTSAHLSTFGLFPAGASSVAAFRPAQRILTPNGDGINDYVDFSGTGASEVHLFDIRGRRVRTLQGYGSALYWYGTDDSGRVVESGVYIYQYSVQGTRVSGVIVVAK